MLLAFMMVIKPVEFRTTGGIRGEWIPWTDFERPTTGRLLITLTPTLYLFGWPLSFEGNLLITSEESVTLQYMSRFSFSIKPREILERRFPILRCLYLGDAFPRFSPLTVDGIRIRGFGIDINPGPIILSYFQGNVQRGTEGTSYSEPAYGRCIYAIRVGIGKLDGSYFVINFFHAIDDTASVDTILKVHPRENAVMGVKWKQKFGPISVDNELALSATSENLYAPEMELGKYKFFEPFKRIITPRISTHYDGAFITRLGIKVSRCQIIARYRYIGPGYVSLGTSGLKTDIEGWTISTGVKLHKYVRLNARWRSEHNNLANTKLQRTDDNEVRGRLVVRVPNLPQVSFEIREFKRTGRTITNRRSYRVRINYQIVPPIGINIGCRVDNRDTLTTVDVMTGMSWRLSKTLSLNNNLVYGHDRIDYRGRVNLQKNGLNIWLSVGVGGTKGCYRWYTTAGVGYKVSKYASLGSRLRYNRAGSDDEILVNAYLQASFK